MARGKTNQPLRVRVWHGWSGHPAVQALKAQGHQVDEILDDVVIPFDLILHPAAGWHESLFEQFKRENGTPYRPYLDARIAWARAQKRSAKA